MKTIALLLILFVIGTFYVSSEETKYLGLGFEPGQGTGWRKAQIIDDFIYVPTDNGLFRKSVITLNDTIWEHFAFKGIPIRNFVKYNDSILAITTMVNDSLMLLSTDNGKTYIDYTSDYFNIPGKYTSISHIEMNPLNKNSMLVLAYSIGLLKSTDFGNTWTKISNTFSDNHFIGFNTNDTTNIFSAGVDYFDSPYIYASYNDGKSWNLANIITKQSTVFGEIFFYPKKVNDMLAGIDNWIYRSRDKGNSWQKADKLDIYNISFAGNSRNTMLFATGKSFDEKMKVYTAYSYDGEFWFLYYNKPIKNLTSAYDIQEVDNDVLLFTEGGVYNITAKSTSLNEVTLDVSVIQTSSSLKFKCNEMVEYVRIYDISGRLLNVYHPNDTGSSIDVSIYNKGIYIFEFGSRRNALKKKIQI